MTVLRAASAGAVVTRCTKSRRRGCFRAIRCASCSVAAAARAWAHRGIGHWWTKCPVLFRIAESWCAGGASGRRRGGCRRTYVQLVAPSGHDRRRLPRVGRRRQPEPRLPGFTHPRPGAVIAADHRGPGPAGVVAASSGGSPAGTGCVDRGLSPLPSSVPVVLRQVARFPADHQGRPADRGRFRRPPPAASTRPGSAAPAPLPPSPPLFFQVTRFSADRQGRPADRGRFRRPPPAASTRPGERGPHPSHPPRRYSPPSVTPRG
ncbi:hypothetical protein EKD16_04285 [Streptomonospora litoralis]|uniref:Uncharacterized protein n=1 Tax=Streptomonospora litoralis TaxID=2498135 RepID=A0A4P6PX22_9ACTN|nr:hypothetical protein EKD16_04285 [Streptomonospora litoralis]